jgi:hypothetical protein
VSLRLRWFSISKSEDAAVRDDFPSTTIELGAGWECSELRAAIDADRVTGDAAFRREKAA